ncbi:MAG: PCRF domain-containing protein, partial [Acidobacteria bacterium]|nr:PCRF domain-containing protein [Acidobacteriota bacterium]
MARDYEAESSEISATLTSIEKVLNLPKLEAEAVELEAAAGVPNLWDDPEKAQAVTSKLSRVQATIARLKNLRRRVDDLPVLFELAAGEPDGSALQDAESELAQATKAIKDLEVTTLLNGEYDDRDALITIRSEAGGVEAADWAEMLMRMYLRYCERHELKVDV